MPVRSTMISVESPRSAGRRGPASLAVGRARGGPGLTAGLGFVAVAAVAAAGVLLAIFRHDPRTAPDAM